MELYYFTALVKSTGMADQELHSGQAYTLGARVPPGKGTLL